MDSFKEWLDQNEQYDFVEYVQRIFSEDVGAVRPTNPANKVWSAKKSEILDLWKRLLPNLPITMQPMSKKDLDGGTSSYGEDGIRITGSWQFIASILGRLKEILGYEGSNTKLRLVFKGVDSNKNTDPSRQSYVFYVNLEPRKRKPKQLGI